MPTSVLVWVPPNKIYSSTPFFDGQRRQGFQWPLAKVDPALAAVLELGLSEEPAPAEAELSEAGGFYDQHSTTSFALMFGRVKNYIF